MSQVPHPHILPLLQQIALPYRRLSWVAYCHQRLILANCRICLNLTKYWQALPKLPRSCLNQKGERMSVGVAGCRFGYFDQRIKLKPVISYFRCHACKTSKCGECRSCQDSRLKQGCRMRPACLQYINESINISPLRIDEDFGSLKVESIFYEI